MKGRRIFAKGIMSIGITAVMELMIRWKKYFLFFIVKMENIF